MKSTTEETPTPETDAMELDDAMCEPRYTVASYFARKLERQRDGAFMLIDYAGELLGVKKQDHKSAHGFKILKSIEDHVSALRLVTETPQFYDMPDVVQQAVKKAVGKGEG